MARDAVTTDRLEKLISTLVLLTSEEGLHWERQIGSAHRYARWNNNLLILGPDTPSTNESVPRYLFITPFDSPACIEVCSDDERLGRGVLELTAAVEAATKSEPPVEPFALTDDILSRLAD
jgi:hypothetical protein